LRGGGWEMLGAATEGRMPLATRARALTEMLNLWLI
jgi:hypothetical protein